MMPPALRRPPGVRAGLFPFPVATVPTRIAFKGLASVSLRLLWPAAVVSGVDGNVVTLLLAVAAVTDSETGLGGRGGGEGDGVAADDVTTGCESGFSCSGSRASVGSVDSGLMSSSGSK